MKVSRRKFIAVAGGAVVALGAATAFGWPYLAKEGKQVFTILHTNDMHSNVIGMAPSSDYTPMSLNDDSTIGGYSRVGQVSGFKPIRYVLTDGHVREKGIVLKHVTDLPL